MSDKKEGFLHK